MKHQLDQYLIDPYHKVGINVIGCGGTGSRMLSELAKLNFALKGLGHPGLHICAWDQDVVEETNVARQMFYKPDIGRPKSYVLIERLNRAYGFHWEAEDKYFTSNFSRAYYARKYPNAWANIYISCVDNNRARQDINNFVLNMSRGRYENSNKQIFPYYWMDLGNDLNFGQVVLGTIKKTTKKNQLARVNEVLDITKDHDPTEPSCSLAVALGRQDLYINGFVAMFGINMLWKLFKTGTLDYNIVYINLDTMKVAKDFKGRN